MIRYEDDARAVARQLAELDGGVIDHGTARTIAAGYNDAGTAAFVTTGAIPTYDDDESDGIDGPAEWLMDSIRHGADARTLEHESAALEALHEYLMERVDAGETGPVDGWVSMDVVRHVDYPHVWGALDTCWCYDQD